MEEKIERPKKGKQSDPNPSKSDQKKQQRKAKEAESESDEEDDEEEEEDIDLEDLEDLDDDEREDLVPHTRTTINNHTALLAAISRIGLATGPSVPFATHQSVVSSKPTADSIEDIQDDLQRELAFYAQALEAARIGRAALIKEGVPFSRPNDYFAEMVKSDGQMEKVKARLVEEATNKKAAAEARKQRDLKKFGKQVQVAKEQERAKEKRATLDKIKTLKRSEFFSLFHPPSLYDWYGIDSKLIHLDRTYRGLRCRLGCERRRRPLRRRRRQRDQEPRQAQRR
jgi:rRNA-processing protein EBP2